MPDDLDSSYRKMDGMMECWNCGEYSPYNPSKAGGTRCENCGRDMQQ